MEKPNIFTKDTDKRFTLRIDKDLFAQLEASAKRDKRSVGKQIEFIVADYFERNNDKKSY